MSIQLIVLFVFGIGTWDCEVNFIGDVKNVSFKTKESEL